MRHKRAFSNPALLAGLWFFLAMSTIMDAYSQKELDGFKATAKQFWGALCRGLMPWARGDWKGGGMFSPVKQILFYARS
jgi:hypothetical protein